MATGGDCRLTGSLIDQLASAMVPSEHEEALMQLRMNELKAFAFGYIDMDEDKVQNLNFSS